VTSTVSILDFSLKCKAKANLNHWHYSENSSQLTFGGMRIFHHMHKCIINMSQGTGEQMQCMSYAEVRAGSKTLSLNDFPLPFLKTNTRIL
jgi:hypothetical protein